ncbi:MAG: 16S rRNA (adenine(1518)-N(6)/adenine(1519)-N(6))-dimethyltransferase RsmA [Acidimicrobiales bacterium]
MPLPDQPAEHLCGGPAGRRLGRAEIIELLDRHGLRPSRALGQNFLADPNVAERIARLAHLEPGERVVEIGAGLGSLTTALAATGARVLALELDRHLLPALGEVVDGLDIEVRETDAMSCDWAALLGGEKWTLVANLPYNIATPLVLELLVEVPSVARMLVMVQRETGERLSAPAGSPAYGAVSARVAYFATASVVGRVPPSVFVPRPKVESVLVSILRRAAPAVSEATASYGAVNELISRAFAVRRKMLRGSLGGLVSTEVFACAGIDSTKRPEELAIEEWGSLAGCLGKLGRLDAPK